MPLAQTWPLAANLNSQRLHAAHAFFAISPAPSFLGLPGSSPAGAGAGLDLAVTPSLPTLEWVLWVYSSGISVALLQKPWMESIGSRPKRQERGGYGYTLNKWRSQMEGLGHHLP